MVLITEEPREVQGDPEVHTAVRLETPRPPGSHLSSSALWLVSVSSATPGEDRKRLQQQRS